MSLPVNFPLRVAKPADLGGALLARYAAVSGRPPPEPARAAAHELQGTRDRLCSILKVSETTAEAVAAGLVAYEWQLSQLQLRLDNGGSELGCAFRWRDAWRPKSKSDRADLGWERACVLFNAASALCFQASVATSRGAATGGLREAVGLYQRAAGCLLSAHGLVREAIWGLSPRWEPETVPIEMTLDFLNALRDLALAQAQDALHSKAIAEGLSPSLRAKLAEGTVQLYAAAKRVFDRPAVTSHLCVDAGIFSAQDRSWVSRLAAAFERATATAEAAAAAAAGAEAVNGDARQYGVQVSRLRLAAAAAHRAASAASELPERHFLHEEATRLDTVAAAAKRENETVFMEVVPPPAALPKVESRVMVKPTPLEPPPSVSPLSALAAAFPRFLPADVAAKLNALHGEVEALLHRVATQAAADAESAQRELAEMGMPQALDACEADAHLPPRLVRAITAAKAVGGVSTLQRLMRECKQLEEEALEAATMAEQVSNAEADADSSLLEQQPTLKRAHLHELRSTMPLTVTRSQLQANKDRLETAVEVTAKLSSRLDAALPSILRLDPPLETLEASLPHLDGTPLAAEPCVPSLRSLLDSLDQLKASAAALVERARQGHAEARESAALSVALLAGKGGPMGVEGAAAVAREPFERVEGEYEQMQQQRVKMLEEVRTQSFFFESARLAEESFAERQEFLRLLTLGAEEATAVADGLTEGKRFYQLVRGELRKACEQAAAVADQREGERRQLLRRLAEIDAPPPYSSLSPSTAPTAAAASASAAAASGALTALEQARSAWFSRHSAADANSPPAVHVSPTRPPVATATAAPASRPASHRPDPPPRPAVATATAARPAPARTIGCYSCRRQFGVPSNSSIVACPYCSTHNRVPV